MICCRAHSTTISHLCELQFPVTVGVAQAEGLRCCTLCKPPEQTHRDDPPQSSAPGKEGAACVCSQSRGSRLRFATPLLGSDRYNGCARSNHVTEPCRLCSRRDFGGRGTCCVFLRYRHCDRPAPTTFTKCVVQTYARCIICLCSPRAGCASTAPEAHCLRSCTPIERPHHPQLCGLCSSRSPHGSCGSLGRREQHCGFSSGCLAEQGSPRP